MSQAIRRKVRKSLKCTAGRSEGCDIAKLRGRASRLLRLVSVTTAPYLAEYYDCLAARLFNELPRIILSDWLRRAAPAVQRCFRDWHSAAENHQLLYRRILRSAFFPRGSPADDPTKGSSAAIGTLGETLFRWLRRNQRLRRVMVEPPFPRPSRAGDVDLVEIHEEPGTSNRFYAIAWEVKATDHAAGSRNAKVYKQLDDYPDQLYYIFNNMSEGYYGHDTQLRVFLMQLGQHLFARDRQVRYGSFIVYEQTATPTSSFVPDLHMRPSGLVNGRLNEAISLRVPSFSVLRARLWQVLHLP
jgi:hypothetical protein